MLLSCFCSLEDVSAFDWEVFIFIFPVSSTGRFGVEWRFHFKVLLTIGSWRRDLGLKSHTKNWRSRGSNQRPQDFRTSTLTTAPRPLLRTFWVFHRDLLISSSEPKAHWWAYRIGGPPSSVRRRSTLFNHWADWSQISYGVCMGWGNESMFERSWSHDQDNRHAHIW